MGLDTIDIEDLAAEFRKDILRAERNVIVSGIVAKNPWLLAAGPFAVAATDLIGDIVEIGLVYINEQIGWIAFRFNTTVFTTDQGKDYVEAIEKRLNLPDDVSDEVWDAAEEKANHAFKNLVNYRK